MSRLLIVGYGNPLRSDDGVGWKAAALLEERLAGRGADVRRCHQLMPELAEPLSRADLAIFIDAACDNGVGEIACRPVRPGRFESTAFSHQFTAEDLLAFTRQVFGKHPEACLFSVGARSFEHGDDLSPEVQAALPALLERAQRAATEALIDSHNEDPS